MSGEDESLLGRFFESTTEPMVMYGLDLRVVNVNQALMTLFRKSAEQVKGSYCYELFYNRRSRCEECHVDEVFRTGETQVKEKLIQLPDGHTSCFEVRSYPVRNSKGAVIGAIEHIRDITRRKILEGRLKESEEKYRTIVEMAREGIYILDSETRIIFANRRMAEMLGYNMDEFVDRSMLDFLDDDAKAIAREQLKRRREGLSDIYELRFLKKDGTHLVGLVSVASMMNTEGFSGCIGILTDITRMKEVEAQIRASQAFSQKIINSITDNLTVVDPGTREIISANESFLARVGAVSIEAIQGKKCYEVLLGRTDPCGEDGIHCPIEETVRTVTVHRR